MPCDEAGEAADVDEERPGGRAFDGALEVLGEAAATAEQGEGSLDHPAPRQDDEALGGRGTLDDLERPSAPKFGQLVVERDFFAQASGR